MSNVYFSGYKLLQKISGNPDPFLYTFHFKMDQPGSEHDKLECHIRTWLKGRGGGMPY